ncbi:MAG: hypothetical protein JST12_07510 [Armatimonadetes bacterium]|nr:hypothetical protein [Armatimonadota bacterium]
MVGGSFASSAWGMPRQTHDLDVAVLLTPERAGELFDAVKDNYMASLDEIRNTLRSAESFRAFQMIHFEETFKLDVFVLFDNEYTRASFERTLPYPMFDDLTVPFASPKDTVVTKLRWFDLGHRVSDKQWNDIVQVLEIQGEDLDEAYMTRWAEHFGVLELLREAQSQVVA